MDEITLIETQEGVFLTHFKDNKLWYVTLTDFSDDMRPGDVFKGQVLRLEGRRAWINLGFSKAALLKYNPDVHGLWSVGQSVCVMVDRVQAFQKGAQVHIDKRHSKESQDISNSSFNKLYPAPEEWLLYIHSLKGLPLRIETNSARIFHLIQSLCLEHSHKIMLKSDMQPSEYVRDAWNIQQERHIDLALEGEGEAGSILIEEGETLTAIDVNTSCQTMSQTFLNKDLKYDHHWLNFNQKCAKIIMQQIQWRHLGGIIIIDFPRMQKQAHQKILFQTIQQGADAKTQVLGFTRGGLFELTRVKSQNSVAHRLQRKPLWTSFLNLMQRESK